MMPSRSAPVTGHDLLRKVAAVLKAGLPKLEEGDPDRAAVVELAQAWLAIAAAGRRREEYLRNVLRDCEKRVLTDDQTGA